MYKAISARKLIMPKSKFESKRIPKITLTGENMDGVLIGFTHLKEAWVSPAFEGKAEPKYQVQVLLHKKDDADLIADLKGQIEDLVEDTWGAKFVKKIGDGSKNEIYSPLVDGADILENNDEAPDYLEDYYALSLKNKTQPAVAISAGKGKPIITVEHKDFDWEDIYPGCYCNISFGLYTWDAGGAKVCSSLRGVIKVADGEVLIGEGKPTLANSFDEDLLAEMGILGDTIEEEILGDATPEEEDLEDPEDDSDDDDLDDEELDEEPEEEPEPVAEKPKTRGRRKATSKEEKPKSRSRSRTKTTDTGEDDLEEKSSTPRSAKRTRSTRTRTRTAK